MDTDPAAEEFNAAELAGRRELAKQLNTDNNRRLAAMAQKGAGIDQSSFLGTRIEILCDLFLGTLDGETATLRRVEFEIECQKRFAAGISEAERQLTRALLLNGVRQNAGQQ